MRQGPHQVAQKSTTTRPSCFSISASNVASVTRTGLFISVFPLRPGLTSPAANFMFQRRNDVNRSGLERLTMKDIPRGTRIAHIGIAVRRLDDLLPFYRDVLGMPETPLDDSDGARIAGLVAGASLVELLEAESPDTPIGRFVA